MKDKIFYTLLILLSLVSGFTSCIPEQDDIIQPEPLSEGLKLGSVGGFDTYSNQVFYDLESNRVVKTIAKMSWELAFSCDASQPVVYLNSGRFMMAANSQQKDFSQVSSPGGLNMQHDAETGNPDSTAIGKWYDQQGNDFQTLDWVYVINRGIDVEGNSMGYKKIKIDSFVNNTYYIQYADLNGSNLNSYAVPINPNLAHVYFTLDGNGSISDGEPDKTEWDIQFGQYTSLLYSGGMPYPYLVSGAMSNTLFTSVAAIDQKDFEAIGSSDVLNANFLLDRNVIGYNWKVYSIEQGKYTLLTDKNWIIKTREGNYYKFHFLDFYNDLGEKGYPKWEFVKL